MAVALLSRPAVFLSGRSAAFLHGLDGFVAPSRPQITVPYSASARSRVAHVKRSQFFSAVRRECVDDLLVASPAETLFVVAEYVGERRLARLCDDLLLRTPAVVEEMENLLFRFEGHRMRGMATLRPLLLERFGESYRPTESELEALAWRVLSGARLPTIERQCPLPWAPSAGRVDFFVADWRLIIELDGRSFHQRTEDFERDRARDNAAIAAGFRVLRFSWRTMMDTPGDVLALLEAVGARASEQRSSVPMGVSTTYRGTLDAGG